MDGDSSASGDSLVAASVEVGVPSEGLLKDETVINIPAAAGSSEVSALESDPEYLRYLRALYAKWTDCPTLTITYSHLSHTLLLPKKSKDVTTVPRAFANIAMSIPRGIRSLFQTPAERAKSFHKFSALHKASGCIAPGSLTLILAPPGHGKTSMLKALSGRLQGHVTGSILYNGMTAEECRTQGINVARLCAYVGQQDFAFPTITVKETLEFAAINSVPDIELLANGDKALIDYDHRRAELLVNLMGLKECKDTILGNDLLRGVSGGQKKRVAVSEMLLTNARVYCLDEVSTGLDAAVTKHIFTQLREAAKITKSAFIAALLQPTPETYSLFDDVILLREGVVVYHGPRTEVDQWLRQCAGFRRPHNIDEAQFVLDVLTDPVSAHYTMVEYEKAQASQLASGGSQVRQLSVKPKRAESDSLIQPYIEKKRNEGEPDAEAAKEKEKEKEENKAKEMADRETIASVVQRTRNGTEENGYTVNFHTNGGSMAVSVENSANGSAPASGAYAARTADIALRSEEKAKAEQHASALSAPAVAPAALEKSAFHPIGGHESSGTLAIDTDSMHFNYKHSHWYSRLLLRSAELANDSEELDATHWSPYTKVMFGQRYPHSAWRHTVYSLQRQVKITSRDKGLIQPRIFQAILMGFVFGTLFFQLSVSDFADKMGLLMYAIMFCAFSNSPEIPIATEAKNVVAKQLNAGFYPSFSYTFSVILTQLPLPLIENIIFSAFLYFIPNLTYDAGRYFFFLLILCVHSTAMSVFFRAVCYIAGQPDIANQMALPFIVIFLVFGGFLLPYGSIPDWLKWCYWISPFSWSTRSLALNEFKASRYDGMNSNGVRIGDEYLSAFGMQTEAIWKWLGVVFLFGFFMIFATACAFILSRLQPVTPLGTRRKVAHHRRLKTLKKNQLKFTEEGHIVRTEEMEEEEQERKDKDKDNKGRVTPVEVEMAERAKENGRTESPNADKQANGHGDAKAAGKQSSSMPFTPVTIAWKDLNYTVFVGKEKRPKQLLHSVNGFALPGEMTALMGASGAGKTTLMDVVAARKTTGKIEGAILVNGQKVSNEDFQHLMGYVEQNDIHMGTATVREALEFSAKLRLPASVSESTRSAFVEEVMHLVGLSKIAHRMVGDSALPGLSSGQLKLVTIAVELVANPSILFLDEPTSGLDAPAALIVMRAIRNIAATGRTVVCTIHQPSAQLFYMFDRLLLLRSGGRTVFFSKIGRKGRKLVDYFESLDAAVPRIEPGVNPANWMLDVIGAAGNVVVDFDFADRWEKSALSAEAKKELDTALEVKGDGEKALSVASLAYASSYERYMEVQKRQFTSHYRNPPMNVTRIMLMGLMGVLFGIIYLKMSVGSFSDVQSKMSALFLGLSLPAAICAGSASPAFFRQRAVYYREKTSGMYDYIIYSTALLLAELPYTAAALACFFLPFYWMIDFAHDAALFWKFALVTYVSTLCYSFLSQLWLALLPNVVVENIVNGLAMTLFFMFGGLFISAPNMPKGWKWFYYIDPVPKAFIAASTTQFYCDGDVNSCPSINVPGVGQQTVSDFVSQLVDGNADDYWRWIGWLVLELAVIRALTLLGLRFISHIKR